MKEHPLIKVVLLLISGILIQHYLQIELPILIPVMVLVTSACILICLFRAGTVMYNAAAASGILLAGALLIGVKHGSMQAYPFSCPIIKDVIVSGTVEGIELKNGNEFRLILQTDSLRFLNSVYSSGLKILVKVKEMNGEITDSVYNSVNPGRYISISGTLFKAREERNPGEFNYYNYLQRKGISAVFTGSNIKVTRNKTGLYQSFSAAVFKLRKSVDRKITELVSPSTASLLRGLLLAERGGIKDDIETDFINTGVVHILAVSGSNVLLVILLFSVVFGRIEIRVRTVLFLAGIFGFWVFTGTGASVTRAVLMASAVMIALLGNRSINAVNAAAISALIILLINPYEVFDPGFQLSYSAVLSIVMLNPVISGIADKFKAGSRIPRSLIYYPGITLAAQAGTLPITLYYFGIFPVIAPAANLIIIPLIGALSATAAGAIILGSSLQDPAYILGNTCNFLSNAVIYLTHWMSGIRYSYINTSGFGTMTVLVFYSGILIFFLFLRRMHGGFKKFIFIILLAAAVTIFIQAGRKEILPGGKLSVMAIDVGQGDATLIRTPGGKTILIDCGKTDLNFDSGSRIIYPLLLRLGIERIDYAFITHVDGDHYSGFLPLLQKGIIGRIYKPGIDSADKKDINLCKYAAYMNVPINDFKEEALTIDNIRIYILYPEILNNAWKFTKNDRSGVIKLVYGENSFLFPGDAGCPEENYLVNKFGSFLKSDILKMGHHGSRSSTSDEFLRTVSPEAGLISAGILNRYGHPAPEILKKLKDQKIRILRTDECGAVLLVSNGINISQIDWKQNLIYPVSE